MAPKIPAEPRIEPSAIVDPTASIGAGTRLWAFVQVGEHAVIGRDCVIGNGAYIDRYVKLGDRVRVHNKALLYHGLIVEDDVFIGPGVCFTNDPWPRAGLTRDMSRARWTIQQGASVGANATILSDLTIGAHAVVGAGAVVTRDVPSHGLVYGNPAKLRGAVCRCGSVIRDSEIPRAGKVYKCAFCGKDIPVFFASKPKENEG